MKSLLLPVSLVLFFACQPPSPIQGPQADSFIQIKIFPLQSLHTHGASIVELPNGDLLSAWFQGSGERWADDVLIMGARLIKGDTAWSTPFVMADIAGFPDINPCLFLDSQERLWLSWYTVLANLWETSLPKYKISDNYMMKEGPPEWTWQEVLHVKPGGSTERGIQPTDPFVQTVEQQMDQYEDYLRDSLQAKADIMEGWHAWSQDKLAKVKGADQQFNGYLYEQDGRRTRQKMGFPLFRRIGWQTKNKAVLIDHSRLILPLYSDGLGFSIMALTDDDGETWQFSEPLVGFENIQASIVQEKEGTLVAYMRDNGPPPQRLQMSYSTDQGMSWSPVKDSQIPNPGSGADLTTLANGNWVIAYNDTEEGRHRLAISLSTDEGKTWDHTRYLETDTSSTDNKIRVAYPSIIQAKDQSIHVVYSFTTPQIAGKKQECIKYARITEEWIREANNIK